MFDKIAIFIRARNGASRLPNKHILTLQGKPIIQHLIERIRPNTRIPDIVLCTTTRKEDDILAAIAQSCGIQVFRGHDMSVLKRYVQALDYYDNKYSHIINIDADDPLLDFNLIDETAEILEAIPETDYLKWEGYPMGAGSPTGMSAYGLKWLYEHIPTPVEHITHAFEQHKELDSLIITVRNQFLDKPFAKDIRLTLDYTEDYDLFKFIYEALYSIDNHIDFYLLMQFLEDEQDCLKINNFRNDDYIKHQKEIK